MPETIKTDSNAGATVAGVLLGIVLIWVFGYASAAVYHAIGGGFIGFVVGAALAFASGYAAVTIPRVSMPTASLSVIKFAVIAMLAVNFLMHVADSGPASKISAACSIIGAAVVVRQSVISA